MSDVILLDSGPLGVITNPRSSPSNLAASEWLADRLTQGYSVLVPEIADYKIRRELLRAGKIHGLTVLNETKKRLGFLPISTAVMLQAAEFWAQARRSGYPTANDTALDGDMILAAQAALLERAGHTVIVATTNTKHLDKFVDARLLSNLT